MGCQPSHTDPAWASYRQQLFKNCSKMDLYYRVHHSGANCSNTAPMRSSAPMLALTGPQPPSDQIHLLHRELLHGLQCGDLLHHTLKQVAHRICGCLVPEVVQGQVEWVSGQPDPVGGIPAHGREGLELDDLQGPLKNKKVP